MDYREPQPRRFAPYQRKSLKNRSKVSPHTTDDQQPWTQEEDEMLRTAVYKHGGKKWKTIATFLDKRTPAQCNARWNELQNHGTAVKRPWSPEEDMQMLELVQSHGAGKWAVIASYLPGRNGKQCRERWHNQLNPAIKKSPWTSEEDAIILEMQSKYGNCWAKITERLPGRTDNAVKNHWHSSMKGKLQHSSPSSSPPSSPSSSSCPSSATVASRTGLTRKRMSTKVTGGRSTRSRSSRRSAHIARGSSSPDCVAASACELDPTSAAYDDFANFALHDPVAPELFDLPRNVFEDVTDPLGFMRDHVLTSWTVPQLHDIADDKRDNMTQNAGECDSASSHFSEMPLSSQPADSLDTAAAESSCVISADAITALAPSPAFGDDATAAFAPSTAFDDDDMSGVSTSTEDTYSDAALSSFDKLCSSEGDSSCGYVKDELPLLESPECTPAPVDTDSLLPLPLTPPCTAAVGTGDEQFHGALFDWEQLPPELHPPELQTAQSSPFESIEIAMSVVEECFDALQALHADPLALYCGTGSDDAMSTQQCHAGPDASLGCMNEDIDALATHLCI